MKYFSLVDTLTYLIPGAVILYGLRVGGLFDNSPVWSLPDDPAIRVSAYLVTAFLVGFVMHYPATVVGRLVFKALGNPSKYLFDIEATPHSKLVAKLRCDYPLDFKKSLHLTMTSHWHRHDCDSNKFGCGQYYALCEALIEDSYPNAWNIHERFYTAANLARAMIFRRCFSG